MKYRQCFFYFLLPCLIVLLSCGENHGNAAVSSTPAAPTDTTPRPRHHAPGVRSLASGKGSLSFKIDGRLYQTDPLRTKCWTSANVPQAMLMAYGDNLTVSWQLGYNFRQDSYRVDRDGKGSISFTIDGKMYWPKNGEGKDYLDITFTGFKDKYNVKLLSGTFEGVLEDKDGHKIHITEGKFVTDDI